MDLFELQASLRLNMSEFNSGLSNAEKRSQTFLDKLANKWASAKGKIQTVSAFLQPVTDLIGDAVSLYSDFQQAQGGLEAIFGDTADRIIATAKGAWKTAGISMNDYMAMVISTGAKMVSDLAGDTEQAADLANLAIVDMADNVNAFGTDMSSVMNAYGGFSRGVYTMLDNLHLGYGGTATEMYRLLEDAAALNEEFAKTAEFSIDGSGHLEASYTDIIRAIHIIQENLGVGGTTAREAETTVSGSMSSMKAMWENLKTLMATPLEVREGESMEQAQERRQKELDEATKNFSGSLTVFLNNIKPIIKTVLTTLTEVMKELIPEIAALIPDLLNEISQFLPEILSSIAQMVATVLSDPNVLSALWSILTSFLDALWNVLQNGPNELKTIAGVYGLKKAGDAYKWVKGVAGATGATEAAGTGTTATTAKTLMSGLSTFGTWLGSTLGLNSTGLAALGVSGVGFAGGISLPLLIAKLATSRNTVIEQAYDPHRYDDVEDAEAIQTGVRGLLHSNGANAAWQLRWLAANVGGENFWNLFNFTDTERGESNYLMDLLGGTNNQAQAAIYEFLTRTFGEENSQNRNEAFWGSLTDEQKQRMRFGQDAYADLMSSGGTLDYTWLLTDFKSFFERTGVFNKEGEWTIPALLDPGENAAQEIADAVGTVVLPAELAVGETFGPPAPDGSFAKGLWDVPYDGFLANLHRNEMVLTASQARDYRSGGDMTGTLVAAIQELRTDMRNLKIQVGERVFGQTVVDYSGRRMQGYIGRNEDRVISGYGWG